MNTQCPVSLLWLSDVSCPTLLNDNIKMCNTFCSIPVDHVIALYPYKAQHADELTFLKDAVINVIKKEGVEWWQGECNGQIGMFPANYVSSTSPDSTSCE